MKTIYLKPETKVVKVVIQNLMAISGDVEGNVNSVGIAGEDYDGSEILSRRSSIWDDDED